MKDLQPFLKLFKNQSQWMLLGTLLAWSAVLMGIGLMSLSGWFISYTGYLATTSYAIATSFNYFFPSAGVRSFSLGRILSRYGERIYTHEATFKILTDVRVWFYEKLRPLAPSHLYKYKSGDLLTRLVNDVAALDNLYIRIISPSIVFLLSVLTVFLLFCFLSIKLAVVVAAMILITGLLVPAFSQKIANKSSRELNENSAELKVQISEHVSSLAELKIFDIENKTHRKQISANNSQVIDKEIKLSRVTGISSFLMTFCMGFTILVATMISVSLVSTSQMNGAFIALVFLGVIALFEAVMPLPLAYQYLGKTLSASKRILQITDQKPDVEFSNNQELDFDDYGISFKKVDFSYHNQANILSDFNLDIKHNEKIALSAPTGTGKSTIINLLARFYNINSGDIFIGNHKLCDISENQLRDIMCVINQSVHIFNSTIRENLTMANSEATDEMMWQALDKVNLKSDIANLKKGLDTWAGEHGQQLSGGQQKRLALARAFLSNKPILILDEPTEGLDKLTEKLVFDNLLELMDNKTSIIITHNSRLLKHLDRVIRM